ncbi:hypothetical protein K1719_002056 [Acacia pycnantha]|nr:hypothetical protein K1719_002056 [Acacia pycnantha]
MTLPSSVETTYFPIVSIFISSVLLSENPTWVPYCSSLRFESCACEIELRFFYYVAETNPLLHVTPLILCCSFSVGNCSEYGFRMRQP